MTDTFQAKTLDSGLKVLVEHMPSYPSVCLGIWIKNGSRQEECSVSGISHFIEHMLFKGTHNRSAYKIAQDMDRVGGVLNAFTGKELTCLHATVLREHIDLAFNVLSDLLLNSLFRESDVNKEKGVIVEEINLYEDTPSEHISDLFAQTIYPDHPLGQPVIGTKDVVQDMNRDKLVQYFSSRYDPSGFVISLAGNITLDEAAEKAGRFFTGKVSRSYVSPVTVPPPVFSRSVRFFEKNLNQSHFCLGLPGVAYKDERRYALSIFNVVFGGGMSSRLFQKIREDEGLVYAIASFFVSFRDSGYIGVYAGTDKKNFLRVVKMILEEADQLRNDGITADELQMAKDHIRGSLLISMESTDYRMGRIAQSEIYHERLISIDEVIEKIYAVTREEVKTAACVFMNNKNISVAGLGSGFDRAGTEILLEGAVR